MNLDTIYYSLIPHFKIRNKITTVGTYVFLPSHNSSRQKETKKFDLFFTPQCHDYDSFPTFSKWLPVGHGIGVCPTDTIETLRKATDGPFWKPNAESDLLYSAVFGVCETNAVYTELYPFM
jgi:hypothetical protein